MGMDIRQTNCPERHKGEFYGVKQSKARESCQMAGPIGTNFGSHLRIHLGMGIGKSPLNTPRGHVGAGGVRGSQIQKS